jgi:hypothetical protein
MSRLFFPLTINLVVCLLFFTRLQAQKISYGNIGCIGFTGSKEAFFTGPVIVDGNACFLLNNGLKTFQVPKQGFFSSTCMLAMNNEMVLNLRVYPNPFVSKLVLKTIDIVKADAQMNIHLVVLDAGGRQVSSFKTNINALNSGYVLNLSELAQGVYFIKVLEEASGIQTIKIIKSN